MNYDVVVLGGGPAGVTAALRARELGAQVALIERDRMGGTCTNDGCVPTRVLAKAARLVRDTEQFEQYGILLGAKPTVDFVQVLKRTQQVVYQVHEKKQLLGHLEDVNIEVLDATGSTHFVDAHTVETADGTRIASDKFVICVGGSARRLGFPGGEYALTHSDVWRLDKLPRSVAIVGGGATGCQLASVFAAFGSEVTLLDIAPRLLITEDEMIAQVIEDEFSRNDIQVITGIQGVERIEPAGRDEYNFVYKMDDQEYALPVEAVILSVGWPGNINSLGLDAAGIETQGSYVKVNDYLQTSVEHIFAAGDITGRMMLVQSAEAQARIAAENAVQGIDLKHQNPLVPHGGFTDPEYGGVGLTEAQAREHVDCAVAVVPYADIDRAVIDGRPEGLCKLVVDRKTHQVIGAHVVGEQALEVVQMVTAGMAGDLRVDQLAQLQLAYPTFAGVVGLAARQLSRELGLIEIAPEWRQLPGKRLAEWERRND